MTKDLFSHSVQGGSCDAESLHSVQGDSRDAESLHSVQAIARCGIFISDVLRLKTQCHFE